MEDINGVSGKLGPTSVTLKRILLNATLGATFNGLAALSRTIDPTMATVGAIQATGNAMFSWLGARPLQLGLIT